MKLKFLFCLICLITFFTLTQAITERDLERFVPRGYRIVKWVEGDLNKDKKKEVVLGIEWRNLKYPWEKNPPAKIIVLLKRNNFLKKYWVFSEECLYSFGLGESLLKIEDINSDGNLEIIFELCSYSGAGYVWMETFVFAFSGKKIVNLVKGDLDNNGGTFIQDFDRARSGKEILVLDWIWGEDESHVDPHRYKARFYGWDPKLKKYKCYKEVLTKRKGEDALKELGIE